MTKKFILTISGIIVAVIAIVLTIVLLCIGSIDYTTTEDGMLAKPNDVNRLYEFIEKDKYDSLILDLSSMECASGEYIRISDLSYRTRLEIDGKGMCFDNMQISTNASEIVIKNIVVTSTDTILLLNHSSAKIELESCYLKSTYSPAIQVKAQNCDVNITGYCEIKASTSANAFEANNITLGGSGQVLIAGGDANSYGRNGGHGLVAKRVSFVETLEVDIIGGNGYEGATGYDGANGRDAEFLGNKSSSGSAGGAGYKGGNGGDALICTTVQFDSSTKVTLQGGNSGNGGRGGRGGDGGKPIVWGVTTSGGVGGAGGAPGQVGRAINIELADIPENVECIDGIEGNYGQRGADGRGRSA